MSLPFFLYAAASAYRSNKDAEIRQLAAEAENTIYEYGYVADASGNKTGALVEFDPKTHDRQNWIPAWLRMGTKGELEKVTNPDTIVAGFTDRNSGRVGKLEDFFQPDGVTLKDKRFDPVQTGLFTDGVFKPFNSEYLKGVKAFPEDEKLGNLEFDLASQFRTDDGVQHNTREFALQHIEKEGLSNRIERVTERRKYETKGDDDYKMLSSTFSYADVSRAAEAANAAVKGQAPYRIRFADGKRKPFQFFFPGTSTELDAGVLRTLDTAIGDLGPITKENVAQFDPADYKAFILGASSDILKSFETQDPDTGMMTLNVRLLNDIEGTLESDFNNLYNLPLMKESLRAAVQGTRKADFAPLFAEAEEIGGNVRVATLDNSDDPNIPSGKKAEIANVVTRYEDDTLNKFATYLMSPDLGYTENDVEKFYTDLIYTYEPGTSGTKKAAQQPKIVLLNELMNQTIAGTETTLFTRLLELLNRRGDANYQQKDIELLQKFTTRFGSFNDQVAFLAAVNPEFSGKNVPGYIFETYTNNSRRYTQHEDFMKENEAVFKAYGNAERFLTGFLSTYTQGDGSPLNIGAKQGEIALAIDGTLFVYDEFIKPTLSQIPLFGKLFQEAKVLGGTVDTQFNAIQNAVFQPNNPNIERFADLSRFEQQQYLDDQGITIPLDTYLENERAANAQLKEELAGFARGATGARDANGTLIYDRNAEINLKLAMRAYYRYMSAYALASATQGGTGGRTISDQDVLNFLRAFQTERLLSNPRTEAGVIENILGEVKAQKQIAFNLSQGGATGAATMKLMSLPGSEFYGMDVNAAERMAMAAGNVGVKGYGKDTAGQQGGKVELPEITDLQLLQRVQDLALEQGGADALRGLDLAKETPSDLTTMLEKLGDNNDLVIQAREELEAERKGVEGGN
jgi:hypothetical protein